MDKKMRWCLMRRGLSLFLILSMLLGLWGYGVLPILKEPVKIMIDERADYLLPLIANGGLETQPDSIYDRLGLNITFVPENDPNACADAVVAGEASGFGTTVSRYAMLHGKFGEAAVDVTMPYLSAQGSGADGLLVSGEVRSVNDLVGRKVAVGTHSEARAIVEWLLVNSGLSQKEMDQIRTEMVLCASDADAARMYLEGNVDAAGLCEPWLSSCRQEREGSRLIFDTGMSSTLSMTGFLFRSDFLEDHVDFMSKFIDGALQARGQDENAALCLKQLPAFAALGDDELLAAACGSVPLSWTENLELLNGAAGERYAEMAEILAPLGIQADPDKAQSAFTDTYLQDLTEIYQGEAVPTEEVSWDDQIDAERLIASEDVLFSTVVQVEQETEDSEILKEYRDTVDRFAQTANRLDSGDLYIVIEGDGSLRNFSYPGMNDQLMIDISLGYANTVKERLTELGVDASRIVTVGNGDREVMPAYYEREALFNAIWDAKDIEDYQQKIADFIAFTESLMDRVYAEVAEAGIGENFRKEYVIEDLDAAKQVYSNMRAAYTQYQNMPDGKSKKAVGALCGDYHQSAGYYMNQLDEDCSIMLQESLFCRTTISIKFCPSE